MTRDIAASVLAPNTKPITASPYLALFTDQKLESDGVFFDDPNKGEYKISRFQKDEMTDDFTNINWTVTGDIGSLTALYTGALTERETDQVVDYTDYVFVGQYLPHHVCDTTVSYPSAVLTGDTKASGGLAGTPTGTCSTPGKPGRLIQRANK